MIYYSLQRQLIAVKSDSQEPRIKLGDAKFIKHNKHFFGRLTPNALKIIHKLEIPAKLDQRTQWSGKFDPMPHQIENIEFMLRHRRASILDDMGVGKTAAALWAADVLMGMGAIKRIWVLCPKSCLNEVWGNECFSVVPHIHCVVMPADKRAKGMINSMGDGIVVTNHDSTRSHNFMRTLALSWAPDLIIVDEASAYKNPTAIRSKALQNFIHEHDPIVWLMTGTPCANGPIDVLGLHKLLNPDTKWTKRRFQMNHMIQVSDYKWVPKSDAMKVALDLIKPSIRHKRDSCFALPPVTYSQRQIDYTKAQLEAFESMQKKLHASIEEEQITAVNAAIKLGKLLQIACGAVINDDGNVTAIDHNRNGAVLELIKQAPQKIIIFAPYVAVLQHIKNYLLKNNITGTEVIWGQVGDSQRSRIIKNFKADEGPKVLLAHPATMAHGLTLTVASTIGWFCPILSLEQYQQANARIVRKSQQHKCHIVHFEASDFERELYAALKTKEKMQRTVLQLAEKLIVDAKNIM